MANAKDFSLFLQLSYRKILRWISNNITSEDIRKSYPAEITTIIYG